MILEKPSNEVKTDLKISVGNKDLRDEKLCIFSRNGQGQEIKPAGALF